MDCKYLWGMTPKTITYISAYLTFIIALINCGFSIHLLNGGSAKYADSFLDSIINSTGNGTQWNRRALLDGVAGMGLMEGMLEIALVLHFILGVVKGVKRAMVPFIVYSVFKLAIGFGIYIYFEVNFFPLEKNPLRLLYITTVISLVVIRISFIVAAIVIYRRIPTNSEGHNIQYFVEMENSRL